MTLREQYIDFDEEVERLEQRQDELATEAASLSDDNPRKAQLIAEGQELDTYLAGVRWARDEAADDEDVPCWDEDVDGVTLAGLTGGEFGRLESDMEGDQDAGSGEARVLYVADGTVEAPYIDESMSDEQQTAIVSTLPITYLKFAEHRIDEMTTAGGNGETSFEALLLEKQATQTDD